MSVSKCTPGLSYWCPTSETQNQNQVEAPDAASSGIISFLKSHPGLIVPVVATVATLDVFAPAIGWPITLAMVRHGVVYGGLATIGGIGLHQLLTSRARSATTELAAPVFRAVDVDAVGPTADGSVGVRGSNEEEQLVWEGVYDPEKRILTFVVERLNVSVGDYVVLPRDDDEAEARPQIEEPRTTPREDVRGITDGIDEVISLVEDRSAHPLEANPIENVVVQGRDWRVGMHVPTGRTNSRISDSADANERVLAGRSIDEVERQLDRWSNESR